MLAFIKFTFLVIAQGPQNPRDGPVNYKYNVFNGLGLDPIETVLMLLAININCKQGVKKKIEILSCSS